MERREWRIKPSPQACFVLTTLYLGAALALWLSPLFKTLSLMLSVLLARELYQVLKKHAWRQSPDSVIAFWKTDTHWGCETRNGQNFRVRLKKQSFKTATFCILLFTNSSRNWVVCIPRDALHPLSYRILLMHLKIGLEDPRCHST